MAVRLRRFSRRTWTLSGVAVLVLALAVLVGTTGGGGGAPSGGPADSTTAAGAVNPAIASGSDPAGGTEAGDVPPAGTERSLVRTAQLSMEIDDPVAGVRRVRAAVAGVQGTVAEEESSQGGARMTLRVPAAALDRLIDDITALGRVTDRSGQVVDATDQVVDLDARVASQQASVVRVRTLLGQATSIGDIVTVESELARREADLDSLTGRLAALRSQVALATLTLDIAKPAAPPEQPSPSGFLAGIASGWDGLRALGSGTGAVLGFVVPFLPVLALLVGVGWLGRSGVRRRRTPAPTGGASE